MASNQPTPGSQWRRSMLGLLARPLACCLILAAGAIAISQRPAETSQAQDGQPPTATPIQHLVVIYEENESFDHYFGTYPVAANPAGEPSFVALPNTPAVNGLKPDLIA